MIVHKSFSRRFWSGPVNVLLLLCLCLLTGCGGANGKTVMSTATPGSNMSMVIPAQQLSPTPPPPPLALLPPGAKLPSETQCTSRVQRSDFEPRPQNSPANYSVPTPEQIAQLSSWGISIGDSSRADSLRKQITGNFTGTTDEILQWVACKWGVEPDMVRAQAAVESSWQQSTQGDLTTDKSLCPPHTWNGKNCYQSYGILQIKYSFFKSSWPMSLTSTAFNAEYAYGLIRACYEGWTTYLSDDIPQPGYARYHAGDIWGCLGSWFSGSWYDQGAIDYIQEVQGTMDYQDWLQPGF